MHASRDVRVAETRATPAFWTHSGSMASRDVTGAGQGIGRASPLMAEAEDVAIVDLNGTRGMSPGDRFARTPSAFRADVPKTTRPDMVARRQHPLRRARHRRQRAVMAGASFRRSQLELPMDQ
jgi:hypothetical protein